MIALRAAGQGWHWGRSALALNRSANGAALNQYRATPQTQAAQGTRGLKARPVLCRERGNHALDIQPTATTRMTSVVSLK